MKNPKFAVVLSGSGVYDGAEIHESVLTLLSLVRQGADVIFMAPNIEQKHVINQHTFRFSFTIMNDELNFPFPRMILQNFSCKHIFICLTRLNHCQSETSGLT